MISLCCLCVLLALTLPVVTFECHCCTNMQWHNFDTCISHYALMALSDTCCAGSKLCFPWCTVCYHEGCTENCVLACICGWHFTVCCWIPEGCDPTEVQRGCCHGGPNCSNICDCEKDYGQYDCFKACGYCLAGLAACAIALVLVMFISEAAYKP